MSESNHQISKIKDTIKSLQLFLDQRISTRESEETALKQQLHQSEENHEKLLIEIGDTRLWILNHDTADNDVLIGKQELSHKTSLVSLTPTFRFEIHTDFPIRHIDDSAIPPTSKWLKQKQEFQQGGQKYVAMLKNKRTASASARIQLYGRRNEVHAVEIARRRAQALATSQA